MIVIVVPEWVVWMTIVMLCISLALNSALFYLRLKKRSKRTQTIQEYFDKTMSDWTSDRKSSI